MERISVYKNINNQLEAITILIQQKTPFFIHSVFKAVSTALLIVFLTYTLARLSQEKGKNRRLGGQKFDFLNFLGAITVFLCILAIISLGVSLL